MIFSLSIFFSILILLYILRLKNIKIDNPAYLILFNFIIFFYIRYYYIHYKWSHQMVTHTPYFNPEINLALTLSAVFFYILIVFYLFLFEDKKTNFSQNHKIYILKKEKGDNELIKFILILSFFSSILFIVYHLLVNNYFVLQFAKVTGEVVQIDRWKNLYSLRIISSTCLIPFFYYYYDYLKKKKISYLFLFSIFNTLLFLLLLGARGGYLDFIFLMIFFNIICGKKLFNKKILIYSIFFFAIFYILTFTFLLDENTKNSKDNFIFFIISLFYNRFYFLEYSTNILSLVSNFSQVHQSMGQIVFNFLPGFMIGAKENIAQSLCVGVQLSNYSEYISACTSFAPFYYFYDSGYLGLLFFLLFSFVIMALWNYFYISNNLLDKSIYMFLFHKIFFFYTFGPNNMIFFIYLLGIILVFFLVRFLFLKYFLLCKNDNKKQI